MGWRATPKSKPKRIGAARAEIEQAALRRRIA
jgi:hypothetical protein